jgi:short-subunit dehydrogenase
MAISGNRKKKKVIILGVNGFLGSNLSRRFAENNFEVWGVQRNVQQDTGETFPRIIGYETLVSRSFSPTLRGMSVIIYAVGNPRLNARPSTDEVKLLHQFITILNNLKFEGSFIFLSSNAAEAAVGLKFSEVRVPNITKYGEHKVKLENLLRIHAGFPFTIVRCPSVIGKDMNSFSHVQRISHSRTIQQVLRMPFTKGNLQVTTVDDLFEDIFEHLSTEGKLRQILHPESITLSLRAIEALLNSRLTYSLLSGAQKSNTLHSKLVLSMPKSISFLVIPHWHQVEMQNSDSKGDLTGKVIRQVLEMRGSTRATSQKIIVSGCSSGLGRETSFRLVQQGYSVIGIDKDSPDHLTISALKAMGEFNFHKVDVNGLNFKDVLASLQLEGSIGGAIACHGYAKKGLFAEKDMSDFIESLDTHFTSVVTMLNTLNSKSASRFFVCIGSSSGIFGLPQFADYSASKAALHSLFQSLILDNSYKNDLLFLIPGGMRTQFQSRAGIIMTNRNNKVLLRPERVARIVVDWIESKNRKSTIKLVGASSIFLTLMSIFPIRVSKPVISNLSRTFH